MLDEEYPQTVNQFEHFEVRVLLSHPYDKSNAILELHPGAGGTEPGLVQHAVSHVFPLL